MVVSCFQRWINRMVLTFFGSANLVQFRTTCERTFEHCVAIAYENALRSGRVRTATRTSGHASIASRSDATSTSIWTGKQASLEGTFKAMLVA